MKRRLQDICAGDRRTLALFRVGLGTLLLFDVFFIRIPDLHVHYTDAGAVPRALAAEFAEPWTFTIHGLFGGWAWPLALLLLQAAFAFALLVGYRTRIATVASWFLFASLLTRNNLVAHGGDMLIHLLLFWSMFLPLGSTFSVDRALGPRPEGKSPRIVSVATLAVVLQVAMMYWFSVVHKSAPSWMETRSAVYEAFHVDMLVSRVGVFLREYPELLKVLVVVTLIIETWAPIAWFCPVLTGPLRTLGAFSLMIMHAGFSLCLNIGYFPFVGIVACSAALPSWFWDRLVLRGVRPTPERCRIYYDGECGFCRKGVLLLRTFLGLPDLPVAPAQDDPEIHELLRRERSWVVIDGEGNRHLRFSGFAVVWSLSPVVRPFGNLMRLGFIAAVGDRFYRWVADHRQGLGALTGWLRVRTESPPPPGRALRMAAWALQGFLAFLLVYVFFWNLRTVDYQKYATAVPGKTEALGYALRLSQHWHLFAPKPSMDDGWFIVIGEREDGKLVDLLRDGAPVTWDKPESMTALYGNVRRRKYLRNLWTFRTKGLPRAYLEHVYGEWNRLHSGPDRMVRVALYYMLEITAPPPAEPTVTRVLLDGHPGGVWDPAKRLK